MSIFTYGFRINKILRDEHATAKFTPAEIVSTAVNLFLAKRILPTDEYEWISFVYEKYRANKTALFLRKKDFITLHSEMIAHFDLIAPYYRFCGNSEMDVLALEEEEKAPYRMLAKKIASEHSVFSPEWMALHQEFHQKFHDYCE